LREIHGQSGIKSQEQSSKKGKISNQDPHFLQKRRKLNTITIPFLKLALLQAKKCYELTAHGKIARNKAWQATLTKQHELCQAMCGLHTLESFNNNASIKKVTQMLMHEPIKEIGDMSLVD
jgi:hypothetical protein